MTKFLQQFMRVNANLEHDKNADRDQNKQWCDLNVMAPGN